MVLCMYDVDHADAYEFCGNVPANPTKQHIREHCRTRIPQHTELLDRVEKVMKHFHLAKDPNDVPLFKPSMLKTWRIQRAHVLRGCLSDSKLSEGITYRHGGTLHLNHVSGEGAKVPIWIPVRYITAGRLPFPSGPVGHWKPGLH
ncbi:hypothetical protein CHARACLAT_033335 [Characodon lateralis]|uniref:Uncharacterized protein n=1 Tax=Characodon lateralis TaxID=208331 RepID=A0ABU7DC45_9TELE|nr:hypothetical protein [Characodon lateralis]